MIGPKRLWVDRNALKQNFEPKDDLPVSKLVAKVLAHRGIKNPQDMISFLYPDYAGLHDPFLLKDMKLAVDRIIEGLKQNQKITIYGDYDVDGITSTSILFLFLRENGGDVNYYIPDRIEEGYGLNTNALKKIKEDGTDLIITVDTGIAAVDEAEFAKKLGLDLIITDHHECQSMIPDAYAVIDPKQSQCKYPFELLAGVGVTFKLIQGLSKELEVEEKIWKYIDIVAIGTVADVVPLIDENRIFVKKGFENIPKTWNIGLKALLKVAGYTGGPITTGLIGFGIAPRLNAAGRIGDAKRGIQLFVTEDEEEAALVAEGLNEENKNRQAMEQRILEEALELIEKELDLDTTKVIVIASENWHHGVIGIAASKIMEKYYRPTILMCIEDGVAKGSARSVSGFNIFEALCEGSSFLDRFGGHEMAAGLSMDAEKIRAFRIFMNEYANNKMDADTLIPKLYLDDHVDINDINLDIISELEKMEPFGVGNPQPLFSFSGEVQNVRSVGKEGSHLKIAFKNGSESLDGIGFGFGNYRERLSRGQKICAVVSLERNEWNQIVKPQIQIKDLKSTEEDEIDDRYYRSLYYLFKATDLKNQDSCKDFYWESRISLEKLPLEGKVIVLVQTRTNLNTLNLWIKTHQNLFTRKPKIWYTNICGINREYDIVVNPMVQKLPLDSYEKIIIYDPLWNDWDYSLLKSKKDILYWVEETRTTHQRELKKLILNRQDFAAIYRYLKLLDGLGIDSIYIDVLIDECNKTADTNIFKVLLSMDVFMELGLVQYRFQDDILFFSLFSNKKISLESSKILQKLIEWSKTV